MRRGPGLFALSALLSLTLTAAQNPPARPPAPGTHAPPPGAAKKEKPPDPEAELQKAVAEAGNDRAALVRNLEDYLRRFPDAPRKLAIYRALVESSLQLRDTKRALDYAERTIVLRPEDDEMMLFAIELLERQGDNESLKLAVDYATRVLDRLEKTPPVSRPARTSQQEWESDQKKMLMSVYLIRGRLRMERKEYDTAQKDLETSYSLLANAPAALRLGEIAELRRQPDEAIERYAAAFVLPDQAGLTVDRREVRQKLGNLWQLRHGSSAGLGELVLQTYDRLSAEPTPPSAPEYNKGIADPFGFALRRVDGSPPLKLSGAKGKIIVLNFWATWCEPCRALEPLLEQVRNRFQSRNDVVFLAADAEEDESRVAPFLKKEKIGSTVVLADGLDRLLGVKVLPTILVLDRSGRIVYRGEGYAPDSFADELGAAIEHALAGAN